jgi:tetratricopeptide (TPR) repeat protein
MAICYYNLGDNTTAISEIETAIKYQPKHQIAYLNLGIINLTAKNIEASKTWFKKTAELDPNTEAGKRAQELLNSH